MALTEFLNVDLELHTRSGLNELIEALRPSVCVLTQTDQFAGIELRDRQPASINDAIFGYFEIVQALSPTARALWNTCERRCLNVGIQAGTQPHAVEFAVSEKTVSFAAAMGAEIVFTVYGSDNA